MIDAFIRSDRRPLVKAQRFYCGPLPKQVERFRNFAVSYDRRMPEYSKTALTWMCLREALLYFPYVIPLGNMADAFFDRSDNASASDRKQSLEKVIRTELLPPDLRNVEFFNELGFLDLVSLHAVLDRLARESNVDFADLIKDAGEYGNPSKALKRFFKKYPHLRQLPLLSNVMMIEGKWKDNDVSIAISSLNLIDTRQASLRQLLEFRRDKEAMNKLRRLRLFAYQNYQGKSPDYIEDDILTRLADYEQAVAKWGFTTATGAINILLNSALIAGGIAGSFLTAYCKAPMEAIAATMSATGVAMANMAVNLGQQRFAQKELIANNPVSYISYAKEKLEDK